MFQPHLRKPEFGECFIGGRSPKISRLAVLHLLQSIFTPLMKPFTRLFLGVIAIPLFRLLTRKVVRVQEVNQELEKDLEQWFRGSLLLLIASGNIESIVESFISGELSSFSDAVLKSPYLLAGRLLLAVGVIEGMPDQALFALIHPGPQKPKIEKGQVVRSLIRYLPQLLKGLICQHLNRSSPVFAILSVLNPGTVGWVCYWIAIAQYLLIGLVTSKDKALDVLTQFDAAVARQRNDIQTELHLSTAEKATADAQLKSMDSKMESL